MKCVLKLRHRVTGNSYYFVRLKGSGSNVRPQSCMLYHAEGAKVFPCVADACAVVKQIDASVWHCRIRPASVVRNFFAI